MSQVARFKYTGGTPGAVSTAFTLFSTQGTGFFSDYFQQTGIKRLKLSLKNKAAGTLNWYRSANGGKNWIQEGTESVAIPTYTHDRDWLVEGARDWKVEWVNAGVTQRAVLTGNVDLTGLTYPGDVSGKTFHVTVGEYRVTVLPTAASTSAANFVSEVQTQLREQIGIYTGTTTDIAVTLAGGTNYMVFTDGGAQSTSSILIEAGSLALATIGMAVSYDTVGWMVGLEATDDRHPLV